MKWDAEATAAEQTKRETLTASTATLKKGDTTVPAATLIDRWPLEHSTVMSVREQRWGHRSAQEVLLSNLGGTYMCGDQGGRVRQFVMPPHPEGEEDDGGQADDGNQGVEQSAEELGLLGKGVGGGCGGRRGRKLTKQAQKRKFKLNKEQKRRS